MKKLLLILVLALATSATAQQSHTVSGRVTTTDVNLRSRVSPSENEADISMLNEADPTNEHRAMLKGLLVRFVIPVAIFGLIFLLVRRRNRRRDGGDDDGNDSRGGRGFLGGYGAGDMYGDGRGFLGGRGIGGRGRLGGGGSAKRF